MSLVSDPELRAASETDMPRADFSRGAPPVLYEAGTPPVRRSARARIAVFSALGLATVLLGLRLLASVLATPLERTSSAFAPTWSVELTAMGTSPTTALLYGPDVGVQLVRVPTDDGASADARTVPARLARGHVHFVALGVAPLHVHARAPGGAPPITFDARGRLITAFQSAHGTGVRTLW